MGNPPRLNSKWPMGRDNRDTYLQALASLGTIFCKRRKGESVPRADLPSYHLLWPTPIGTRAPKCQRNEKERLKSKLRQQPKGWDYSSAPERDREEGESKGRQKEREEKEKQESNRRKWSETGSRHKAQCAKEGEHLSGDEANTEAGAGRLPLLM